MKTAYVLTALLLFSPVVKAEYMKLECGSIALVRDDNGAHIENKGIATPTFKITFYPDVAVASNASAQPRGADVQHTEYAFKGLCADQSVKMKTSYVGGFAGTIGDGEVACTCDLRDEAPAQKN